MGTLIIVLIIVPIFISYASDNNYLNSANAPYSVTLKLINASGKSIRDTNKG